MNPAVIVILVYSLLFVPSVDTLNRCHIEQIDFTEVDQRYKQVQIQFPQYKEASDRAYTEWLHKRIDTDGTYAELVREGMKISEIVSEWEKIREDPDYDGTQWESFVSRMIEARSGGPESIKHIRNLEQLEQATVERDQTEEAYRQALTQWQEASVQRDQAYENLQDCLHSE